MKKTNTSLVLEALWLDHIDRFSDRLRARLYDALISYLRRGIPVPEKYMPYLGIIIDLIAETGIEVPEPPAAPLPNPQWPALPTLHLRILPPNRASRQRPRHTPKPHPIVAHCRLHLRRLCHSSHAIPICDDRHTPTDVSRLLILNLN